MWKIIEVRINVNLLNYWQYWLNWDPWETQIRKFASRSRFKTNGCHRSLPRSGTFKNRSKKKDVRLVNEEEDAANCNGNYDKNRKGKKLASLWWKKKEFRSSQKIHFFIVVFESSSPLHHPKSNHESTKKKQITHISVAAESNIIIFSNIIYLEKKKMKNWKRRYFS